MVKASQVTSIIRTECFISALSGYSRSRCHKHILVTLSDWLFQVMWLLLTNKSVIFRRYSKICFGTLTVVTSFGEFSPFWQNLESLGQFFQGLFWKILDRLWLILYAIGQVFIDVNGQMLKNNLSIWSQWTSTSGLVRRNYFR